MTPDSLSGPKASRHLLKILDGAFQRDPKTSFDAATELAAVLEAGGASGAAGRIRKRLERVPGAVLKSLVPGQHLSPVSSDGGRQMLDETQPASGQRERLILTEPVNQLIDEFLAEIRAHDALAEAGVADPCRLLIEGPPGVGKSSVAMVIASEVGVPLLTVRCDGAVGSLMGSTGSNLRKIFEHASKEPCVLLLDEFDALARARSVDGKDVGEMHRVVIGLLQSLDALPDEAIVIAATNHAHLLDPAVWRRFPRKLELALPGMAERAALWGMAFKPHPADGVCPHRLAEASEGMSHADITTTARQAIRAMILAGEAKLTTENVLARLPRSQRVGPAGREIEPAAG